MKVGGGTNDVVVRREGSERTGCREGEDVTDRNGWARLVGGRREVIVSKTKSSSLRTGLQCLTVS